jgi:hypothetical protein
MSPIYVPGKLTLSKIQQYPAVLGEPWGGGYFAGYISHTADGNPTHALIVAPAATGATGTGYTLTTNLQLKISATATAGASSSFDGAANTAAMLTAGIDDHPAAKFCVDLNIGGFTDWYLPARYELSIAYFNFKPSTASNSTTSGLNDYSVPKRVINNTVNYPTQTNVALFNAGIEAFTDSNHWTSEHASTADGRRINFVNGLETSSSKTQLFAVRAFRRIAL